MKKLALVAGLALCATVGGVYANWVYAGEDPSAPAGTTKTLTITQGSVYGVAGTLSVTAPTRLAIDGTADYHAKWADDCAGDLTITFAPGAGAPVATFDYVITILNNSYTDPEEGVQKIINVTDQDPETAGDQFIVDDFMYDPTDPTSSTMTWSIDQVKAMLPLNQAYTVGTYAEYQAYEGIVTQVTLKVDVKQRT